MKAFSFVSLLRFRINFKVQKAVYGYNRVALIWGIRKFEESKNRGKRRRELL